MFDEFYADDIEVSNDTGEGTVRGKARVRSPILNFLLPFHIMAEISGLSISIRETAIPGDAVGETHSAWTLDLVGVTGRTCTLSWRAPPQVECVARGVRASLRSAAKRRAADVG
jgi:hypothetical protein